MKYFDCAPGRGTFVTRSKITTRLRAVSDRDKDKDKVSTGKKKKNKNKTDRSSNRLAGVKSPRTNNGSKSPRSRSNDSKRNLENRRKNRLGKGGNTKTKTGTKNSISFNIDESLSLEEKISFIFDRLKDTKSQFKGRQKMLKTLSEIFEKEEKMDDDLIKKTIEGYRKPFTAQLAGKRVTIHKAAMDTLIIISKTQKEQFNNQCVFYIKKLIGHCKHPDPKSVTHAEKTISLIIKETNDKSLITAALIQAATHAKNKIIRKHSWQFLNETLKYYLPAKGQAGISLFSFYFHFILFLSSKNVFQFVSVFAKQ